MMFGIAEKVPAIQTFIAKTKKSICSLYIRKLCDIIEKQRDILKKFRRKINDYQVRSYCISINFFILV